MPFITLNNNWSNLSQYYNQPFNNKPSIPAVRYTAFDDGLIRGGVINTGIATAQDTLRIGKFFVSGKGALFITKQVGLQLSNPKLEINENSKKDTFGKLGTNTKSNLLNKAAGAINTATNAINKFINERSPNQIYNLGLNTLTQIPLVAAGGHIIRHGLLPVSGGSTEGYSYEKAVKANNDKVIDTISSNIISSFLKKSATPSTLYRESPNRLLNYLDKIATDYNYSSVDLQSYNGGPDSTYGIGKTIISTSPDQRTDVTDNSGDPKKELLNGFSPDSYKNIINDSVSAEKLTNLDDIFIISTNFHTYRQKKSYIKPDNTNNIEDRIGVSKIGGDQNINKTVDSINVISITSDNTFYTKSETATLNNNNPDVLTLLDGNKSVSGYFGHDIIKFRLEFLDNDTNTTNVLAFRAYIDDFNDGMNAKWNSYRYMGRGEEFYVYEGFTRDISVAFTIYAHSPEEMKPLYQKLNYLMSTFAPDYNAANKMRGNIGYLTVGDYIYRQPGIFTDIKLSGFLNTHWEIAMNEPESDLDDKEQYEMPKHINVALSFKPIHNFLPRRATIDDMHKTPFITPNEGTNKYLSSTPSEKEAEAQTKVAAGAQTKVAAKAQTKVDAVLSKSKVIKNTVPGNQGLNYRIAYTKQNTQTVQPQNQLFKSYIKHPEYN